RMSESLPSSTLIDRIIASDAAHTAGRIAAIAADDGNSLGAEMLSEGRIHVFGVPGLPTHWLNRAMGLGEATAGEVPRLAAWLRDTAVRGCCGGMPDRHGPILALALADAGFVATRFDQVSWATPRRGVVGLPVETVDGAAAMERFLDCHLEAWGMPAQHRDG